MCIKILRILFIILAGFLGFTLLYYIKVIDVKIEIKNDFWQSQRKGFPMPEEITIPRKTLISSSKLAVNSDTLSPTMTSTPNKLKQLAIIKIESKEANSSIQTVIKNTKSVNKTTRPQPQHHTTLSPLQIRYKKQLGDSDWKEAINTYLKSHEARCKNENEEALHPHMLPYCACVPKTLVGYQNITFDQVPLLSTIHKYNPEVKHGGHWIPSHCTARMRLAIIIPFRDRESHLLQLLKYLTPVLQGQQVEYTIYVIEQASPSIFNKAVLMNVGYIYAKNSANKPNCFIFHDVDMMPEDGRHFYWCRQDSALHLGAYHDRHDYRLIYSAIFGGVTAFRGWQFEKVNGFSNRYFGWGGEDDDMGIRTRSKIRISRDPKEVAGYTVIRHLRDKGNIQTVKDSKRKTMDLLRNQTRINSDGLNSLNYKIRKEMELGLYTWIYVDIYNSDPLADPNTSQQPNTTAESN